MGAIENSQTIKHLIIDDELALDFVFCTCDVWTVVLKLQILCDLCFYHGVSQQLRGAQTRFANVDVGFRCQFEVSIPLKSLLLMLFCLFDSRCISISNFFWFSYLLHNLDYCDCLHVPKSNEAPQLLELSIKPLQTFHSPFICTLLD